MKNNPRLSAERAAFLAQHWSEPDGAGTFPVAGDPAHRIVNPTLYRIDEVLACWQSVECPVLWVQAAQTDVLRHVGADRDAALREVEIRKDCASQRGKRRSSRMRATCCIMINPTKSRA